MTTQNVVESALYWQILQRGGDIPDLADLIERPDWHRHAACRGLGPELFFSGRSPEQAKSLCAVCTVREPCRQATPDPIGHGIWGGTTPTERRVELRGGPDAACA